MTPLQMVVLLAACTVICLAVMWGLLPDGL